MLLALASAPVVARTRLFCRYSGIEITDCVEAQVPGSAVLQLDGCCDHLKTDALGIVPLAPQHEAPAAPVSFSFRASPVPILALHVERGRVSVVPTGQRVLLVTRALLI
jgi:hypothetical protein